MFCTHCGTSRGDADVFCHVCGARLPTAEQAQPADVGRSRPDSHPGTAVRGRHPDEAGPRETGRRRWGLVALVLSVVVLMVSVAAGGAALMLSRHDRPTPATASSPPRHTKPRTDALPAAVPTGSPAATVTATATATVTATPAAQSFADLYRQVSSGVVRIETTACDGGGVGSGFLIAPDLVATVAHVVADANSVVVRAGRTTTTGTVVGYDPDRELALVRTGAPLVGHVFRLDPVQPDVGTGIGAIGYPMGGPQSLTTGSVSGLERRIDVDGHRLAHLIQTDASINFGNSGGPLLTVDGTVVGIVEAKRVDADSIGYAIPADLASGPLTGWQQAPAPVHWISACSAPTGPDGLPVDITDRSGHPDGAAIMNTFAAYVDGINSGDYRSAYAVLTPHAQQHTSYGEFSRGTTSSFIVHLTIDTITETGRADTADVRFTSVQDPSYGVHGQDCSNWTIDYTMVPVGGSWLIDSAVPRAGSPTAC